MKNLISRSNGIGLIEVLITTIVISVGILAVASLQGNLIGMSGENKARAEAKALCDTKIEQLRDTIVKGVITSTTSGEYNAITTATQNNIIGTNETFTRTWTVTDKTNPTRKQLSVNCSWGNADAEHQIVVQSVISYEGLGAMTLLAKSATGGSPVQSPSTTSNSSHGIYDKTDITVTGTVGGLANEQTWSGKKEGQYLKVTATNKGSVVYRCEGDSIAEPFIYYEDDIYTRRFDTNGDGFKEVIELAISNGDSLTWGDGGSSPSCTRHTSYDGGIILPIKGYIYDVPANKTGINPPQPFLVTLKGTESDGRIIYCSPSTINSGASGRYACYIGGNCVNGPIGIIKEGTSGVAKAIATNGLAISTENTIVTQCPSHPTNQAYIGTAPYATKIYAEIGPGGWRASLGFVGRIYSNTKSDDLCFDGQIGVSGQAQARNYKTVWGTGTSAADYGINRPALCHDFLWNSCTVGALKLAKSSFVRTGSGAVVIPVNLTPYTDFCHTITGDITGGTPTGITATSTNGGFDCTLSGSTYTCIGTSKATSVTINATGDGVSGSCNITGLVNTNMAPTGCPLAVTGGTPTTHTISGIINTTGTFTSLNITENTSSGSFSGATCSVTGTDYSCINVPNTWGGTLKAIGTCNGTISDNSALVFSQSTADQSGNLLITCIASCTVDSVTVNSGSQVTAYQAAIVISPATCSSETRNCTNGTLSGTYAFSGCSVVVAGDCTFNGSTVNNSSSVTAYNTATVPFGNTCTSESRLCTNGTLSGSYTNGSCTVDAALDCTFNGSTVNSGSSVTAYQTATVPFGSTCTSESRSCTDNGTLLGNYTNSSCSVDPAPVAKCTVNISGGTTTKQQGVTSDPAGCSLTSENNKSFSCSLSNQPNGTNVTLTNGSTNNTVTFSVNCTTDGGTDTHSGITL